MSIFENRLDELEKSHRQLIEQRNEPAGAMEFGHDT